MPPPISLWLVTASKGNTCLFVYLFVCCLASLSKLKVEYWPVFRFAIEIHPTGEVSAYTATVDYVYENKVDTVTFGLKAEGKALFHKIIPYDV